MEGGWYTEKAMGHELMQHVCMLIISTCRTIGRAQPVQTEVMGQGVDGGRPTAFENQKKTKILFVTEVRRANRSEGQKKWWPTDESLYIMNL